MQVQELIEHFELLPHPEGGYYKETYRSDEFISKDALPERFSGDRSFCTAIYFLLEQGDYSAFHRIKSDECWHFYAGDSLIVHVITTDGNYYTIRLGNNIAAGEVFQAVVPAGAWFASEPAANSKFCFVGCTVAPGFDFNDFEMADKKMLSDLYPEKADLIKRLCR